MGLGDFLNNVVNSIPVVGHIKGVVHNIVGDHAGATEAYVSASRTTAVVVGAAVGGPVGAVAAGALADTVSSAVTAAPLGVVGNVNRIFEARHVKDVLTGVTMMGIELGLDAISGGRLVGKAPVGYAPVGLALRKAGQKEAVERAVLTASNNLLMRSATKVAKQDLDSDITISDYIIYSADDDREEEYQKESGENKTNAGYIYTFPCADDKHNKHKVGRTKRPASRRLGEHARNKKNPERRPKVNRLILAYKCRDPVRAEGKIKKIFRCKRIKDKRLLELFEGLLQELIDAVIKVVVAGVNGQRVEDVEMEYYILDSDNKIVEILGRYIAKSGGIQPPPSP